MEKVFNILFCGVGGQGVLKAAEICSWAAMTAGYHVKKSEVHGMAQRGGSVESHVRFGKKIFSPLIAPKSADFLVPFNSEEQARYLEYIGPATIDLLPQLQEAQKTISNIYYLNTYLLGALSQHLPINEEIWLEALKLLLPGKVREDNIKVFKEGRSSK